MNCISGISPHVIKDVFPLNTSFNNIRNRSTFYSGPVNSVCNGTESLSPFTPNIWKLVPNNIKAFGCLSEFKNAIKLWKVVRCPCRICKTHSTNWLRVVNVCSYFCIYHLLRGVQGFFLVSWWKDIPWVGSFQRFLGNSTEALSKLFPYGDLLAKGSGKDSVFQKVFLSYLTLFYLVQDSWLRLSIGYINCIFRCIAVLVVIFK